MSGWRTWGGRLLLGAAAVVTGAFARRTYDRKVRQLGRPFREGDRTLRSGSFTCERCGASLPLEAGGTLPACPGCGHAFYRKTG